MKLLITKMLSMGVIKQESKENYEQEYQIF